MPEKRLRIPTNEPLIALVLNQESKTADDVYADIYAINDTSEPFIIKAKANFFQTVSEETGEGITHGPRPVEEITLEAKSFIKVGDIIEWELDSALWFDVAFKHQGDEIFTCNSYDLKSGKDIKCTLPVMNIEGYIYMVTLSKEE